MSKSALRSRFLFILNSVGWSYVCVLSGQSNCCYVVGEKVIGHIFILWKMLSRDTKNISPSIILFITGIHFFNR